jgi:hypothetical protein
MSTEMRTLLESRRNVMRAALALDEGIAAVRRRLERARGIEPNSLDFSDSYPEEATESETEDPTGTEAF